MKGKSPGMKKIILGLAIMLALVVTASPRHPDACCAPAAAKPKVVVGPTETDGVPDWGLGPFVRDEGADFIKTDANSIFKCPVRKSDVRWEEQAVLCAGAVVKDNKVYILYRAEDSTLSQPAARIMSRSFRIWCLSAANGGSITAAPTLAWHALSAQSDPIRSKCQVFPATTAGKGN
jgi:hypothetical protein